MFFPFFFSYYNLAELYMDTAKNDTAFSTGLQYLVFVKSEKNKQKRNHSYTCVFYDSQAPRFNPVNVPQSGCGCLLPLCHWALSARICRAVTFPGPHSNGLQSGSVGQCAVCVCVSLSRVALLFWSTGMWCPAGYGKWMVAQLAMSLMGLFFFFGRTGGLHTRRSSKTI